METFTRRIFEREAILLEAEGLFSEIDALERPDEVDDVRAILEGRIPELNERSLRVLDLMDEEAPNWGRFGALAPAIASFFERWSADKAAARERALRLIGIPHPTVKDLLENDEVAELLYREFECAGTINHFGVRHAQGGDLDLAIRFFSAAITLCPVHAEPQINRGKAYLMTGQEEKGLQDYENAYVLSAGDAEVEAILRRHERGPWSR